MRMYELWKTVNRNEEAERLEDAGGPVLFPRACDAEAYLRAEPDRWKTEFQILPVTVGLA
jgi:hypothetical protein